MPYVLRKAVSQYPVTLYASAACTPCDAGHALGPGTKARRAGGRQAANQTGKPARRASVRSARLRTQPQQSGGHELLNKAL
jgi:hypothetical protein